MNKQSEQSGCVKVSLWSPIGDRIEMKNQKNERLCVAGAATANRLKCDRWTSTDAPLSRAEFAYASCCLFAKVRTFGISLRVPMTKSWITAERMANAKWLPCVLSFAVENVNHLWRSLACRSIPLVAYRSRLQCSVCLFVYFIFFFSSMFAFAHVIAIVANERIECLFLDNSRKEKKKDKNVYDTAKCCIAVSLWIERHRMTRRKKEKTHTNTQLRTDLSSAISFCLVNSPSTALAAIKQFSSGLT